VLEGGGGGRDANPVGDAFSAMLNWTEIGGKLLTLIEAMCWSTMACSLILSRLGMETVYFLRRKFFRNEERWKFRDETGQLAS
jgi:hypothetical protein